MVFSLSTSFQKYSDLFEALPSSDSHSIWSEFSLAPRFSAGEAHRWFLVFFPSSQPAAPLIGAAGWDEGKLWWVPATPR